MTSSTVSAPSLGRDIRVMGLVGAAHWASHFFHLVLPAVFLLLHDEFQISFAALGLLTTLMYGASGLAQTAAGFMVDRFGARRVLLSGLTLLSTATLACGLVNSYWMLLPLSALAGLGNSVFHPADLSILTAKVSPHRLGRGYATHALCGNLGWAAAPTFMITISQIWDWRVAIICSGLIGLAIVAAFLIWGADLEDTPDTSAAVEPIPMGRMMDNVRLLLSTTIISCFLYFAFLAAALIGIQSFGMPAMVDMFGLTLAEASRSVTGFLLGTAGGIFIGGILADRTDRHDRIAISGMITSSLFIFYIAMTSGLAPAMVLGLLVAAGVASGVTTPSRDMLVRAAAPKGASGRVFGFVYSGLDLGSALIPLALGFALDQGRPETVFYAAAGFMAVTALTVVQVRRQVVTA
ncbi:MAG: MFS transporter [Rhodospirillaceae bacterium]|nr:MFS transporter [Rhodospirillaceae bacterium]MBT3495413.1 MFS transporter [Rhodospirillaceae bacterium]MBT3782699.1 MFS transporter [Rhodospirillaceae bacterium]MBT3975544.1 MFS transporter [Rhodospirillaceae bacterium]MBT4170542.1 MFS transporter [Rhodospirillaceae bacterium]